MMTTTEKSPYQRQLSSPLWQKKRLKILERDGFSCRICADTETELHVHHKKYIKGRKAHEAPDEDLETLCKHCHSFISEFAKNRQTEDYSIVDIEHVWYFNHLYPNYSEETILYTVFCKHKFVDEYFIIQCFFNMETGAINYMPFIFDKIFMRFVNKIPKK